MINSSAYRYQCVDHSILDPYLRKWVVKPLYNYLPKWIPANLISIFGHTCVWGVFCLCLHEASWVQGIWFSLFFLFMYLVFDIMDGMRARDTQTSSPLGEFVDHGGDAYNCGVFVYFALCVLRVQNPGFLYLLIVLGQMIFSLVTLEKKITGGCVFPKVGNVELQVFLMVFSALLQVESIDTLLSVNMMGFSFATWLMLVVACIGGGWSIKSSLSRIKRVPKSYVSFVGLSLIFMVSLTQSLSSCSLGTGMLILFMGNYNGRLLLSYLSKSSLPPVDRMSCLFILGLCFSTLLKWHYSIEIYYLFFVLLVYKAVSLFWDVFSHYGRFWIWVNPRLLV